MKDSTIIIIVAIIGISITASICGVMYLYNKRAEAAFKAGLEEGTVPGERGSFWVKPR